MDTPETLSPPIIPPAPVLSDRETWPSFFRQAVTMTEDRIRRLLGSFDLACTIQRIMDQHPTISFYPTIYGTSAGIVIVVDDLKDAIPVVRAIRVAGFDRPRIRDDAEQKTRTYHMGNVTLEVHLNDNEKATCKFVQSGTKTVPTYKMICDDPAALDIDAIPAVVSAPAVVVSHEITTDDQQPF